MSLTAHMLHSEPVQGRPHQLNSTLGLCCKWSSTSNFVETHIGWPEGRQMYLQVDLIKLEAADILLIDIYCPSAKLPKYKMIQDSILSGLMWVVHSYHPCLCHTRHPKVPPAPAISDYTTARLTSWQCQPCAAHRENCKLTCSEYTGHRHGGLARQGRRAFCGRGKAREGVTTLAAGSWLQCRAHSLTQREETTCPPYTLTMEKGNKCSLFLQSLPRMPGCYRMQR